MKANRLLAGTLALVLIAGISAQAWAQTVPTGEDEPLNEPASLGNPQFVPGSGSIFVIEACPNACFIQEWDPINKLLVNEFQINAGNGRALAFDGTDLWYTAVNDPLLHKISTIGGPDITTIPAPPNIAGGGLDYDFSTDTLVAVTVSGSIHTVSVLNPNNGNVLASCTITGNNLEDWAVAVSPAGGAFWGNGGKTATGITEYDLPLIPNQGACNPTGNSFDPTSVNVDFLDFDVAGNFIVGAIATKIISDLDGNPLAPPVDSFNSNRLIVEVTTTAVPEIIVGGELLPIETTSLLLAAVQSPASWFTSLAIAVLGIGAYVFTRNPNNMRNIKVILRDYLDRF